MFSLGNYKVQFSHRNRGWTDWDGNPVEDICGETACRLVDKRTNKKLGEIIITCKNGENNSKNARRKRALAIILSGFFPTNLQNPHKNMWNKKARTLFWKAYSEKRGGLENQLPKENLNVVS